jgi:nucleoside-diphosphate-sugar epimerase
MKALVVGGTGPTGPFIVNGLIERGYQVSIFHRGKHEIDEIPPEVEHIHADPHFRETIDAALEGRHFDLAVVTYGRIRVLAKALEGKVDRFLSVGGYVGVRGSMDPSALFPTGMTSPVPEDASVVDREEELRIAYLVAQTEKTVLESHPDATHFRYPAVYGPHQMGGGREWSFVRRILDRRPFIVLPDGGLSLFMHGFAGNLAHAVLLAVDQPENSAGQIYHCGDERQLTMHQIVEVIATALDHEWEIVCMPDAIAHPARYYAERTSHHQLMDLAKIKRQLGYRDVHPAEEALRMTVEWLVANPPADGSSVSGDPFDYAAEDKLVAAYRESLASVAAVPFNIPEEMAHPYAHPKEASTTGDHRER